MAASEPSGVLGDEGWVPWVFPLEEDLQALRLAFDATLALHFRGRIMLALVHIVLAIGIFG